MEVFVATTPLQSNNEGVAAWIDRSAAEMDPHQYGRELVQNAGEAGASTVWIDAYEDPETGDKLLRVTDDGSGMTEVQLRKHIKTLHFTSKKLGPNYGVGARMALLPANPAGVTFASRATGGEESLVMVHRNKDIYGLHNFEVVDDEGFIVKEEAIAPDQGELTKLGNRPSGTAVILRGDGRHDTWSPQVAYQLGRWLSDRYLIFPNDLTVKVQTSEGASNTLAAFGSKLIAQAESEGVVAFDIDGLSGTVTWWVLKPVRPDRFTRNVNAGVGVVVDHEILRYGKDHLVDFGLIYKQVTTRVVLLVQVEGSFMSTARAGVVIPGHPEGVPWKRIGAAFSAQMPAEIQALIDSVRPAATSLTDAIARSLDPEWQAKIKPVPVLVPAAEGDPEAGGEVGEAQPETGEEPNPIDHEARIASGTTAPTRRSAGDRPARRQSKRVPPNVEFLDADQVEFDHFIRYAENSNTVQVSRLFPPYVRDVARWAADSEHSVEIVTQAVEEAYGIELAAAIVDANGQKQHGIDAGFIEQMKEPASLYVKCCGVQALEKMIEAKLQTQVAAL
jgi:hypothetical protein